MPVALPAPELSARVALLWSTTAGERVRPMLREFLPDASTHLIFRLSPSGCRMVLLGPVTERAVVELAGGAEYIGVRFRTGEAPALADATPSEMTNAHAEVLRLGGVRIDSLGDQLMSLPDFASRARRLEELLRGAKPHIREARCRQLSRMLESCGGRARVDALASELDLHPRSLERLCQQNFGMSPKRLLRLVRLRQLLWRLNARDFTSLAELAYDCGYADQSHMIRDFKTLTGRLPGETAASLVRPVSSLRGFRVVHRVRYPAGGVGG